MLTFNKLSRVILPYLDFNTLQQSQCTINPHGKLLFSVSNLVPSSNSMNDSPADITLSIFLFSVNKTNLSCHLCSGGITTLFNNSSKSLGSIFFKPNFE